MDPLNIALGVGKFIASAGVSTVVANAIKHTTPEDLTRIQRISVKVGTVVLGAMASDIAKTYAEKQIKDTAAQMHEAKKTYDDLKKDMS